MARSLVLTVCCLLPAAGLLPACGSTPRQGASQDLPIEVRRVPARTVLIRSCVGPYSESQKRLEEFVRYAGEHGIVPRGDLMGVFFDDPETTPPAETRYEIRLPVSPETAVQAPYGLLATKAHDAAMVEFTGSYEAIARRYGEIFDWIEAHGYVPDGPLTEVYLVHPGSGVPPAEYVTEVLVPVRPR